MNDLGHLLPAYHNTGFTYSLCLAYFGIFERQILINMYNIKYDKADFERSL